MVKRILAALLSLTMLFFLFPNVGAYAADEIVAEVYNVDGSLEKSYTDLQTALNEAQLFDTSEGMKTVKVLQDLTVNTNNDSTLQTIQFGIGFGGCSLDLNGHTITIKHPSQEPAEETSLVCGVLIIGQSATGELKNGTIKLDFASAGTVGTYGVLCTVESGLILSNIEVISNNSTSFTSGIAFTDSQHPGHATKIIENSVVDVNGSAISAYTNEDKENSEPLYIVSGSYKNLTIDDSSNGVKLQESSNKLETTPSGVDEGKTVITSPATTAMVVQDGNAYLYDSLQDAVDAKGQGETATTIQVMKDPKDVINVSPTSNFSLTTFGNAEFTGGLKDQYGNVVRAGTNSNDLPSVSNGILSVPVGGSVTTSDGTVIKGSNNDVPKIGANGEITVPVGGTITTQDGKEIEVQTEGVTVGSDGQISGSATSVELDQTSVHLYSNTSPSSIQLHATVTPADSIDTLTWTSSDTSVAKVDDTGLVTAVGDGKATITVTVGTHSAECIVTVSTYTYTGDYNYPVTIGKTEHGTVTIAKEDQWANDGEKIAVTVTPDDAYMLDKLVIKDKAGNELQVKDNGDGTYTFTMPEGAVTITATFVEDPDWVEPEPEEPIPEPSTDVTDIFSDVTPGAWYVDVVQYAYDHGLMTGTSATTFEPDTTTSRAMIVSILHRLEGSPSVGTSDFSDVVSGAWYADPVAWAAENGIVAGFENGTFGPNDPITREQMASILYRYAEYKGIDTSARADLSAYSDQPSAWAQDVMEWANAEGLINGTTATTLDPQGTATRAQVAAMLQRFIENVL